MKKLITLLLAVLMIASLTACGNSDADAQGDMKLVEKGKLIVATEATFPPYEMVADNGKGVAGTGLEGIDIEIAAALAEKLDLELVVDNMDFDAALLSVQNGKADIVLAGVSVTPEREKVMSFSSSYATSVQVVIVKEDSDIKSASDLVGKKIGTQQGTTGYIYCSDEFGDENVIAFDNGATAVQNLIAGKVDAVVIDKLPAEAFIKNNDGLVILESPYAEEEYAIGMAIDNAGLQKAINDALAEMDEDGTLQKIVDKYINAG